MLKPYEVTVSFKVLANSAEEAWETVNTHMTISADSIPRNAVKVLEVAEPEEIRED